MFDLSTPILIADDMLTMRKLVAKSCKDIGFTNLTEAKDGAEAWEKLNAGAPAFGLIISDWNMPNVTGIELLKKIRADSTLKKLPFILVTAEAEKTQIVEALQAGVSGYVVKPFTTDSLKAQLEVVHQKQGS